MKAAIVFGDMSADRTDDQYPTMVFCDACFEAEKSQGEDCSIVNETPYDPSLGDTCEACGKSAEEEDE